MNNRIGKFSLILTIALSILFFASSVSANYGIPAGKAPAAISAVVDANNPGFIREVEQDDFRISFHGPIGDGMTSATLAAITYNETQNEYFVVWRGNVDYFETEIFGRRIDAATGALLGDMIRISDMGPAGSGAYKADAPAVAYNSTTNEYLVVWYGDNNYGSLADQEFEIWGQRIDAATGAEVGVNDFRISSIGSDGDASYTATYPDVVYNSVDNQYLVTFRGGGGSSYIYDIYGQLLDASGGQIGTNDFQIGNTYRAYYPAGAYNSTDNEYFIVWDGGDPTPAALETYGQRLSAAGSELGTDIFLSDMEPEGDSRRHATYPRIAYNSLENTYLTVWQEEDSTNNKNEIVGQLITNAGVEFGTNDFQISDMGPVDDGTYDAWFPDVVYNSHENQFFVVWTGDDNTPPHVDNEQEVFGQLVSASGSEIGDNDFPISSVGPDGDINYDAFNSAAAYDSLNNRALVVWGGDDHLPSDSDEREIYGQILAFPLFQDNFETGTLARWTRFNDGGGFLYACTEAAINGTWGACVERGTNDKRKQLIDETPVDQTSFAARISFDINSLFMAEGERFRFVQTKMGAERPFFIVLKYQGGQYYIQLTTLLDDLTKSKTGWFLLTDEPHTIEVNWQAASGEGANDGFAELYIDGMLQEALSGLDSETIFIEKFKVGFTSRLVDKLISGVFYIDDVITSNDGYIGVP